MKKIKQSTGLFHIFCFFFICHLFTTVQQVQAQTSSQIVRVAFLPEMYGFYIIEENGDYSGYNYEYLMNVAQHTNWKYEFVVIEEGTVSASLAKAEEMMMSGDLDLVGPYSVTSSRFQDFETGKKNYGVYRYNYYSALKNNAVSQDNYFLKENLRVGLVAYYTELNDLFFQQIANSGFEVEPVYADSHGEMIEMLLNEEVDTIINLDMSSHSEYLSYLTTVQRIPFYFASTKGNTQLMEELDQAISGIEIIEPEIHQRLLDKYFGVSYVGDFAVSEVEMTHLAEIDSFKVGFLANVPPYQYINEEGEYAGISVEIVGKMAETTGIPFEIYWFDDLVALSTALKQEEIDLVGTLSNNYNLAHSLDVTLTTPYISGGVYWIKNENSAETVAPMYHYVSDNIPFYSKDTLTMVWDMKEALETVESSPDVSVICDPNITNYYLSLHQYEHITVQAVSNVLSELTFGVGKHIDVNVTGMLNRAILFLDTYEVDELIFHHTSVMPEYTRWDLIKDYAFEIYMTFTFVVFCVLISIYRTSKKFRQLSRCDSLTKLHNSGYFHEYVENKLGKIKSGVLILVDIDYFKDVNDTHGHNMGDKIIQQVAEKMTLMGHNKGFYARVGGDEFALLLEGTVDKGQLEQEATAFLKAMAENETGIPATLSIGGFMFSDTIKYETLYKNADIVLYNVKEHGRNGFLMTNSIDEDALNKASNLLSHQVFQQKVTQLIALDKTVKNHALLLIYLENLQQLKRDEVGDLFEEVAVRIKNQVRQHDFLCGKEDSTFLLFLSSCGTTQNLSDCKQRIEKSLNEPYRLHGRDISVKSTVSVAVFPEDGANYQELMEKLHEKKSKE